MLLNPVFGNAEQHYRLAVGELSDERQVPAHGLHRFLSVDRGILMRIPEVSAATVADVKYHNCVFLDGEQHSVLMRLAAKKKLTHFKWEFVILWSDWTTVGKLAIRE